MLGSDDPMHSGQQFKSKGRFKASDKVGNSVEPRMGGRMLPEKAIGITDGSGHDLELLVGRVTSVPPPRPLPSGGMAIERMFFSRITRCRSRRPASMSSIRILPRQCRLVGKLIMYRGLVS